MGEGQERTRRLGASIGADGVASFAVRSASAERIEVCLFGGDDRETARHELSRDDDIFSGTVAGLKPGQLYGFRADGPYDPDRGLWFDPDKLLVDPYAVEIDRPYRYDPRLAAPRGGPDTAPLMPKARLMPPFPDVPRKPPLWREGGLIYELGVKSFTIRHPEVPGNLRGTVGALAHPAVLDHLTRLGVTAVELMPIAAWIDERHLPPLGLANAWGYNPVTFMALDPRIAPGGLSELRAAVAALHAAGIGVILDVVFNHTGESDRSGPTLSLRGLDAPTYFRHGPDGALVNDAGTGNTLACDRPAVCAMVLDAMRHFVRHAGVDGFRFDLAPILGRTDEGFDPDAPLLAEMAADEWLADRVLIAEPWDIGPAGYQLGNFRPPFLEWNDRYRDDVRRFWKGGDGMLGALGTRLAGSSDIFERSGKSSRTVNFIAAHDGMTLADVTAYAGKHNQANGEDNRDGHNENESWNRGVEGPSDDPAVRAGRRRDMEALLATLFASRGAIMLTAGDEFGRTQHGNNNAYAQDNETLWLDWTGRDRDLEAHVAALAALRRAHPALSYPQWPDLPGNGRVSLLWRRPDGHEMGPGDWDTHFARAVTMVVTPGKEGQAVAILVNGADRPIAFSLPGRWQAIVGPVRAAGDGWLLRERSVAFLVAS